MKIETYPLIVGAIVGIVGLLLLFDAWTPDDSLIRRERRRAPRSERSRGGETAIGFGVLCLAAAILGRDTWPYTIVSAIAGAALLLLGGIMSRRYIRGRLVTYVDEPASVEGNVATVAAGDVARDSRELPHDRSPEPDRQIARDTVRDGSPEPQRKRPGDGSPPEPAPGDRLRIR